MFKEEAALDTFSSGLSHPRPRLAVRCEFGQMSNSGSNILWRNNKTGHSTLDCLTRSTNIESNRRDTSSGGLQDDSRQSFRERGQ